MMQFNLDKSFIVYFLILNGGLKIIFNALSLEDMFKKGENMPYFDRFDICEAYLAIEMDWNVNGLVEGKSYSTQLHSMKFRASPLFRGYDSLSENGKEIYLDKCFDLGYITQSEWEEKMDEVTYG